jgi:hypothetical protein
LEIFVVLSIFRLPRAPSRRLVPAEERFAPLLCLVLLTGSCVLASFAFACATPFAAFAVVAADLLPLPLALLVMTVPWLVNQAIGFLALGYPLDAHALLWGLAIGAAAMAATAEASALLRSLTRSSQSGPAALGIAILGAYSAYEVVLFAFTPLLGGAGAFTFRIILRLGILNLLWLIGLSAACIGFHLCNTISQQRKQV